MEALGGPQSTPGGRGGAKCIALAFLPCGSYTRTPVEILRGPRGKSKQRGRGMALISEGRAQGVGKPGSSAQCKKEEQRKRQRELGVGSVGRVLELGWVSSAPDIYIGGPQIQPPNLGGNGNGRQHF